VTIASSSSSSSSNFTELLISVYSCIEFIFFPFREPFYSSFIYLTVFLNLSHCGAIFVPLLSPNPPSFISPPNQWQQKITPAFSKNPVLVKVERMKKMTDAEEQAARKAEMAKALAAKAGGGGDPSVSGGGAGAAGAAAGAAGAAAGAGGSNGVGKLSVNAAPVVRVRPEAEVKQ
jgi:hypothetical protein